MGSINVNIRLRPIRFVFLVRPDDKKRTLDIFRINTCLWGGKYNPIIPFFKRLPTWWERKGYRFENAKQIINGYLDFFEPDFIVEAERGLASGLGFAPERVLQLADLLERDDKRDKEKYGLSVYDLYRYLYRKEFQFVHRHKHTIVHVKAKDATFANFVACTFGDFPAQKQLEFYERDYKDVFDPESVSLDSDSLFQLYKSGFTSALRIGHAKLKIDYHDHQDPTLFILDAHQPKDLIDFWNLRAVHQNVVAVPVQWIETLSPFCKKFILDNHRPLPGNPNGVMIHPASMFSRSIPDDDIEEIHKNYLRVDKEGANCLQTWYPPIWREPPEMMVRTMRPTLEADIKGIDIPINEDKPEIRFDPLYPEFASEYGNYLRWANVVRLRDWSHRDQIATVFPSNYKNPSFPKFRMGREHLLPTSEGLIFFPEYRNISEWWNLTDGTTALNTWFNENKITAVLSDAGKATQQIIHTLEGFWGVRALAHKGIIELLNKMSRSPVAKSAHFKRFQNEINNAVSQDIWRYKNFETLVERKAVELGLELKCSKCNSWSWYSVKQLDYSLTCDLCLKSFDFPITNPGDSNYSRWAYRVIGPFALPDYARGGYAAALSIRFFSDVIGRMDRSEVTWSSGQELTLPSDKKSEADFILWNQRKKMFGNDYPTEIVFGEAKSFGKDAFKQRDVDQMKLLAEAFPGAVLVFATMKEAKELSQEEIFRIRKLAEWGREYDKERKRSRAPVIMLTGTELFTVHHLSNTWKEKGGKHKKLIEPAWVSVRLDNLRMLADLTQQLYLDMPSYGEWREEKWKKRADRKKKK
ncbi:MAG: hypothetical protein OEZ39_11360 [Gammaproteobacteria bacterium]|nr:hypothetical protein [Gammaproteobacteria bacterium]MDH5652440.1 hypothetical protein [Gammaproteobacteria bacterium]